MTNTNYLPTNLVEVLAVSNWINGSGWEIENSIVSSHIANVHELPAADDMDWGWLLAEGFVGEPSEDGDQLWTLTYYAPTDDSREHPIAQYSIWASDAIAAYSC